MIESAGTIAEARIAHVAPGLLRSLRHRVRPEMPQRLHAVLAIEFAAHIIGDFPGVGLDPPHRSQTESDVWVKVALVAMLRWRVDRRRIGQAERIEHGGAKVIERRDHFVLAHVAVEGRDRENLNFGVFARARVFHGLPGGADLDPILAQIGQNDRLSGGIEQHRFVARDILPIVARCAAIEVRRLAAEIALLPDDAAHAEVVDNPRRRGPCFARR